MLGALDRSPRAPVALSSCADLGRSRSSGPRPAGGFHGRTAAPALAKRLCGSGSSAAPFPLAGAGAVAS
eukprot:tig00000194_g14798.t1